MTTVAEARIAPGDQPLYQTRVAAAIAPMHSDPLVASQQVSQQLAGHEVSVMDEDGDWILGRGADRYEGWMHTGFLEPRSTPAERGPRRVSLGCTVERTGGFRRSLPLRALLRGDERVVSGEAVDAGAAARRFPLDPAAIAASAQDFFRGTSYVWGGVTPWGADCSGFVQSIYALHGRILPRDAWQQAELGRAVDGDFHATHPADLCFFTDRKDRKVTHVGIALGGGRMVHLSLGRGGYGVEEMSGADSYVISLRERFLFFRRLL